MLRKYMAMLGIVSAMVFLLGTSLNAEMRVSDFWGSNGAAKIPFERLTESQKAQIHEWERKDAEYVIQNYGKKCSDLKDIPEYTRLFSVNSESGKDNSSKSCFGLSKLADAYFAVWEYEKWFSAEKRYYETREDREDPYAMLEWLRVMLSAGRYTAARDFFPECVNSLYPWFSKDDIKTKIAAGEKIPIKLASSIMAEPWQQILEVMGKEDDPAATVASRFDGALDVSKLMHGYFYSDSVDKKEKALKYYSQNHVNFMLEKAARTWDGELKGKASAFLKERKTRN